MSNMKCPFCKKELKLIGEKSDSGYPIDEYFCGCPQTAFHFGNAPMWKELRVLHDDLEERREYSKRAEKELIRTRKALGEANEKLRHCVNMTVEELDELKGNLLIAQDALLYFSKDPIANNALKKITTSKQKEVK